MAIEFSSQIKVPNDPATSLELSTKQYVDTSSKDNIVIDGNFQISHVAPTVGTEITNPSTGTYPVFDMWKTFSSLDGGALPTTIKHSKQLLTPGSVPNSKYCARLDVNGAGSGFGANAYYSPWYTYFENATQNLCGASKTITVSFYARSTISNKKIGIFIEQNYGTGGSPTDAEILAGSSFLLTSTATKFTYTFTTNTLTAKTFGTNNDDRIGLGFAVMWGSTFGSTYISGAAAESFVGSGVIEITQVQVVAGSSTVEYKPVTLADELNRVCRYLRPASPAGKNVRLGYISTGYPTIFSDCFFNEMRIAPTLVVLNTTSNTITALSSSRTPGTHINFVQEGDTTTSDNSNWNASFHNSSTSKMHVSVWMNRNAGSPNYIVCNMVSPYNLYYDSRF